MGTRTMKLASTIIIVVGASRCGAPALARDYGIYSGRGYNPVIVLHEAPRAVAGPYLIRAPAWRATFGTAANPAPIRGPALLFEVGDRTPVYNAPGRLLSGTYRVVFP
jgi:hypothetical protein